MKIKLSHVLITLGILIMIIGAGVSALPEMSHIKIGDIELGDIGQVTASIIFVGLVIFLGGLAAYFKGK